MIRIGGKEVVRIVDRRKDVVKIVENGIVLFDATSSCFAAGYWNDDKPWTDEKGWKD